MCWPPCGSRPSEWPVNRIATATRRGTWCGRVHNSSLRAGKSDSYTGSQRAGRRVEGSTPLARPLRGSGTAKRKISTIKAGLAVEVTTSTDTTRIRQPPRPTTANPSPRPQRRPCCDEPWCRHSAESPRLRPGDRCDGIHRPSSRPSSARRRQRLGVCGITPALSRRGEHGEPRAAGTRRYAAGGHDLTAPSSDCGTGSRPRLRPQEGG